MGGTVPVCMSAQQSLVPRSWSIFAPGRLLRRGRRQDWRHPPLLGQRANPLQSRLCTGHVQGCDQFKSEREGVPPEPKRQGFMRVVNAQEECRCTAPPFWPVTIVQALESAARHAALSLHHGFCPALMRTIHSNERDLTVIMMAHTSRGDVVFWRQRFCLVIFDVLGGSVQWPCVHTYVHWCAYAGAHARMSVCARARVCVCVCVFVLCLQLIRVHHTLPSTRQGIDAALTQWLQKHAFWSEGS